MCVVCAPEERGEQVNDRFGKPLLLLRPKRRRRRRRLFASCRQTSSLENGWGGKEGERTEGAAAKSSSVLFLSDMQPLDFCTLLHTQSHTPLPYTVEACVAVGWVPLRKSWSP